MPDFNLPVAPKSLNVFTKRRKKLQRVYERLVGV